jgi:ribosome-binding protein aMBF1 (putative translation factor)
MNINCKTQLLEKFKGKSTTEFNTFQEKIICARINFSNKKNKGSDGLSQDAAAKKIGIKPSYLCRLEKGNRAKPAADVVYKIEKAYGFASGELAKLL